MYVWKCLIRYFEMRTPLQNKNSTTIISHSCVSSLYASWLVAHVQSLRVTCSEKAIAFEIINLLLARASLLLCLL